MRPPKRLYQVTVTHHWRDWARSQWTATAQVIARTEAVAKALLLGQLTGFAEDYEFTARIGRDARPNEAIGVVDFRLTQDDVAYTPPALTNSEISGGPYCAVCGAPIEKGQYKYCKAHTYANRYKAEHRSSKPGTKLDAHKAGQIRWLLAQGVGYTAIRRMFGISQISVANVLRHRTYPDVPPVPAPELLAQIEENV